MKSRLPDSLKLFGVVLDWVLLTLALLLLFVSLILLFVSFGWSTGFGQKTLWDWLDLLIVPAVLAFGAFWVNRISQRNEQRRADRENQIEREIASERNQEAALQAYLDRMTDLLLKENLRASKPDSEVRTVARTRTLTVLRGLDPERKSAVVRFLIETDLVSAKRSEESVTPPIISLSGADLSGANLSGADLSGADLSGVDLSQACLGQANLNEAQLFNADMSGADLLWAKLRGARLTEANLSGALMVQTELSGAKLYFAELSGTNLSGANMSGASVSEGALKQVRSLEDATMPNGQIYNPNKPLSEQIQPAVEEKPVQDSD